MSLVDKFWSEEFWLPKNVTWADVTPGPDKEIVYANSKHVLYYPILALVFLFLRYVLSKYVYAPLGKSLGVEEPKRKRAPNNPKLETAYGFVKVLNHNELCCLAKQLDMSERQMERWWRLRRNQDKPFTLTKFCEHAWKATYYLFSTCFGLVVLWDKEWLWDIDHCYIGYPHQGLTNDVWWYYMITGGFCWSLAISQFWDVKRKDFWQTVVHHVATIALLHLSWVCNLFRVGTLLPFSHDCSEIFLDAAKAAKYANWQKVCNFLFAAFTVVWIVTRLGMYPFYIVWSTLARRPKFVPPVPMLNVLTGLLLVLLLLHIVWTRTILQIAIKAIKGGETEDCRSASSGTSDSSQSEKYHNGVSKNKLN